MQSWARGYSVRHWKKVDVTSPAECGHRRVAGTPGWICWTYRSSALSQWARSLWCTDWELHTGLRRPPSPALLSPAPAEAGVGSNPAEDSVTQRSTRAAVITYSYDGRTLRTDGSYKLTYLPWGDAVVAVWGVALQSLELVMRKYSFRAAQVTNTCISWCCLQSKR